MRTPHPERNEAELSTVAERGETGGPQTHVEAKEALYKGRAIEDSHMGGVSVQRLLRGACKGSPGATDRAKERGSETGRGERASKCSSQPAVSLLSHPGQSAPKVLQSAAMQKHPHSCLLCCCCLPKA